MYKLYGLPKITLEEVKCMLLYVLSCHYFEKTEISGRTYIIYVSQLVYETSIMENIIEAF